MRQTVVAALIQHEGQFLICRRKPDQPHPLKWEFPGGKLEPGETPADGLRRELAEELDIIAAIGDEIERYEYRYPGREPILLIFFAVMGFTGEPSNRVFQEIRWVDRSKLPVFDFLEGDVEFIRRLAGG